MTRQIPLSQIGDADAFKQRVEAFRQAKIDHHKTLDVPAPQEHHLVEAVVRRVPRPHPNPVPQAGDGVARSAGGEGQCDADGYEIIDYEIVDDRPSLRARKDALIHQVAEQERELMIAAMAPGKRRLAGLRAQEIYQKPPAERSDADNQFLAATQARLVREAAIGRHAAELQAAIEDLTEQTIGAWQPAPFPADQPPHT
jgi:hypothetical protein